jgi:hypothetical protein
MNGRGMLLVDVSVINVFFATNIGKWIKDVLIT